MPTHAETRVTNSNQRLGPAAKHVAEHASALARLELELAALELKRKVTALGLGLGLALAAGIFLLFMLAFGFATLAAGLATEMSTWLALLITTGILFGILIVLAALALGRIRKGTPPLPKQAIHEAKLTTEVLKGDGSR